MKRMFIEFKGNIEIEKNMHDALKACLSNDKYRMYMCNVYIEKEYRTVTATNGQVMLQYVVPTPIEASGWYECAKIGKKHMLIPVDIDIASPNYSRVIPEYTTVTLDAIELSGAHSDISKDSRQICNIILESKCKLNLCLLYTSDAADE